MDDPMTPTEFQNSSINELLRGYQLPCSPAERGVFLEDFYSHLRKLPVDQFNACVKRFVEQSEWDKFPTVGRILTIHRELFGELKASNAEKDESDQDNERRARLEKAKQWYYALPEDKRMMVDAQMAPKIQADIDDWERISGHSLMEELVPTLKRALGTKYLIEAYDRIKGCQVIMDELEKRPR